jgi:hypothetical protein
VGDESEATSFRVLNRDNWKNFMRVAKIMKMRKLFLRMKFFKVKS